MPENKFQTDKALDPVTIKAYTGKIVRGVCFDNDFRNNKNRYQTYQLVQTSRKGAPNPYAYDRKHGRFDNNPTKVVRGPRYDVMTRGRDFAVIAEERILVDSPTYGDLIIELGTCEKFSKVKYLMFKRNNPNRSCVGLGQTLAYSTGNKRIHNICTIQAVKKWTGGLDLQNLAFVKPDLSTNKDQENLIRNGPAEFVPIDELEKEMTNTAN